MKKERVKIRGTFSIQPKVPEILVGTLYIKTEWTISFGLTGIFGTSFEGAPL